MKNLPVDNTPACSELLGTKIARDIFALGSDRKPCWRIQFMAGDSTAEEKGQGGLCEEALARTIAESIRVHMSE